jgi:hypothetical protein
MNSCRPTIAHVVHLVTGTYLLLFPKIAVRGQRVIFTDLAADRNRWRDRLEGTLKLLAEAGRHRGALHRIRHIVVWPGHYTMADRWGGIHLSSDSLDLDDIVLAGVLVHEATHLRIRKHRIKSIPSQRARIEAICVKAQAAFLREVGGEYGPLLASTVEEALGDPWWTDEKIDADLERAAADAEIPAWLTRILRKLRR